MKHPKEKVTTSKIKNVRMQIEEWDIIKKAAKLSGLKLSTWIRHTALKQARDEIK